MSCHTDVSLKKFDNPNHLAQDTKKVMVNNEADSKCDVDETRASIAELFPWVPEFQQMCKCLLADQTMASLTELMQSYMRNVSISVNECCTKPLRASKLKDSMNETLLLFLYIYRTISENQDRQIYLGTMSDLLAKYIDMELKASKRSKEDHEKISARLMSCLYIYLGHSTEHLLNTIIKIQFMSRNYHGILHPIIKKIMKNVPMHPESNVMYIRYFLIYRLWRKISNDVAVKNDITATAMSSLGMLPVAVSPCELEEVLPKVPKSQPYCTKALLQQKFDIKKSCELFIEFCRSDKRNAFRDQNQANRNKSQMLEDNDACKSTDIVDSKISTYVLEENNRNTSATSLSNTEFNNLVDQANSKPLHNISNNISNSSTSKKSTKCSKSVCRRKSKLSKEIVIIDLTSDVVSEKVVKKKQTKKLAWLEEVKKRIDTKTLKTSLKKMESSIDAIDVNRQDNTASSSNQQEESLHHKLTCVTTELNSKSTATCDETDDKSNDGAKFRDYQVCCAQSSGDSAKGPIENLPPTSNIDEDSEETRKQTSSVSSSPQISTTSQGELDSSTKSVLICSHPHTDVGKVNRLKSPLKPENCGSVLNNVHTETVIKRLTNKSVDNSNKKYPIKTTISKAIDAKSMSIEEMPNSSFSSPVVVDQQNIIERSSKSPSSLNMSNTNKPGITSKGNESVENDVHTEKKICVQSSVVNHSVQRKKSQPEESRELSDNGIFNTTFSFSVMKGDHSGVQAEMEVDNGLEETDNMATNVATVFERQDKLQANTKVSGNIIYGDPQGKNNTENLEHAVEKSTYQHIKSTCGEIIDGGNDQKNTNFHTSLESVADRSFSLSSCSGGETIPDGDRYVIQDPELQGNIDGLSLLASVSQHVPHLKAESEPKYNQIKVKDYASLRNTSLHQADKEEPNASENLSPESHIFDNPTTEIINRIVGIYPEENLDKVALHVEVSSTRDVEPDNSVEYNSHMLPNNVVNSENGVQAGKENTNVILNGETVVLLQKSPNSNLYIINKAVENGRDQITEDEACGAKEKSWLSVSAEDGSSIEVVNGNDHPQVNYDLSQYNKEYLYQERKFSVARSKGIKIELEETEEQKGVLNFAETKVYVKKTSLLSDPALSASQHGYPEANVTVDKRKINVKSGLSYGQNVKQEYNTILNHITSNCGIPAYQTVRSHQHDVIDPQHSLHVPASHSNSLLPIYSNCPGATDLCVPYHKHCSSASCNLQINNGKSLRQHPQANSSCGRTHCTCLNCAYDIVTHCPQYLHSSTESHMSCIENKSYFLPSHSSVQTSAVQDYERTTSGTVITKLYDDQLLCKIEKSLLKANSLEKVEVKRDLEKFNKDKFDNKLPLKKRLKAMMSMTYDELPLKKDEVNSYPAAPMMSIAALETLDNSKDPQIPMSSFEIPRHKMDDSRDSHQVTSDIVRREYYKDMRVSSNGHRNMTDSVVRKHERQFCGEKTNDATVYQESFHHNPFKTPAQRKQGTMSTLSPLKRLNAGPLLQETSSKKLKKSSSSSRQTRSSKRNVPKVNYSYTDVDPEWNPSGESKRKRKKTSR